MESSDGVSVEPMRPLRFSINVTLDGCCDHQAIPADLELHEYSVKTLNRADELIFGRVTYELMESAWRLDSGEPSQDESDPFAETIHAAKKHVVSNTLQSVDWNAELIRGDDLVERINNLKEKPGKGLLVGGTKLALSLAELGLIDEYEIVVHPRFSGHGPSLFAGLSKYVDLKPIDQTQLKSGAVALRYEPIR